MRLQSISLRLEKLRRTIKSPHLVKILLQFRVLASLENWHILDKKLITLVDIGANRCQFALAVRNQVPNAKIISFEPLKEPAEIFRRIFANDQQTTLHEIAIGPEERQSIMHVSKADDFHRYCLFLLYKMSSIQALQRRKHVRSL